MIYSFIITGVSMPYCLQVKQCFVVFRKKEFQTIIIRSASCLQNRFFVSYLIIVTEFFSSILLSKLHDCFDLMLKMWTAVFLRIFLFLVEFLPGQGYFRIYENFGIAVQIIL